MLLRNAVQTSIETSYGNAQLVENRPLGQFEPLFAQILSDGGGGGGVKC